MSKNRVYVLLFVLITAVLATSFIMYLPTTAAPLADEAGGGLEVVISGLNNPRGLQFGPDGGLYVAEAGSGGAAPCVSGPEGDVCYGASGSISRIMDGLQSHVVTGLVSLAAPDGSGATGVHDVAFDSMGNLHAIVGLGADPALRDPSGPLGDAGINFGQLISVSLSGTWTNTVDVSAFEGTNNPDGGEVDSNPYGLWADGDNFLVADAGGNDLLHVAGDGAITTTAVFTPRLVPFVTTTIPMQAVPTAVTIGPDGAYYVGQLTGFPFPVGGANVYRVEAGSEPEVYASGFTNILDLAFGSDGSLYVLEMFTNGILSGDPTGAVIRVAADGQRTTLASEGLVTPGGLAVGLDGYLYVTNFSTSAGIGEVVRIPVFETVASGLDNPRGLVFGPDGALYVAEAGEGGQGPCVPGPEGEICYGATGAVSKIMDGMQTRIVSDMVSLAISGTNGEAIGPHDVAFDVDGNLHAIVGLGADPALRDPSGPLGLAGINFGQLVSVSASGTWTNVVDVAGYEGTNNPDGGLVDSNPYGLIQDGSGFAAVDAGGNTLLGIDASGMITTLAVFPTRTVEFPPGVPFPMDAVPTAVAIGPDGAYYVGQLTGFPFPVGDANVYRVEAGSEPTIYAAGFTNIIDIAFDKSGNLYVLEITHNGLLSGDLTGAIIRVSPSGTQTMIATEGLTAPGGIAVGNDCALYVSNQAIFADAGTVVRVPINCEVYLPMVILD